MDNTRLKSFALYVNRSQRSSLFRTWTIEEAHISGALYVRNPQLSARCSSSTETRDVETSASGDRGSSITKKASGVVKGLKDIQGFY